MNISNKHPNCEGCMGICYGGKCALDFKIKYEDIEYNDKIDYGRYCTPLEPCTKPTNLKQFFNQITNRSRRLL